jgi:hypothetical protein
LGIAQITQKEAETAYGKPIKWIVNGVIQKDKNDKPIIRGYGLCTGDYDYRPNAILGAGINCGFKSGSKKVG